MALIPPSADEELEQVKPSDCKIYNCYLIFNSGEKNIPRILLNYPTVKNLKVELVIYLWVLLKLIISMVAFTHLGLF